MIHPKDFTNALIKNDLGPVVEVPCSYFKDFLNYLWDSKEIEIINPVSEGVASGIASGYYLSTGKIPVLAIQNSGLMNTLNALTSLNQIYDIPLFYMVTWRGEGGVGKDAPEHDITGGDLLKILKTFNLPYEIIDQKKYPAQIKKLKQVALRTKKPVVLIIKKNTFEPFKNPLKKSRYEMSRMDAIKTIKNTLSKKVAYISSTGFPTRDSFNAKDTPDFYIVGSMGHAFAIALGVSANTNKKVVVLDGDGSSLMHAGGLASFDKKKNKNIIYIVLDNESYESTGGQVTVSANVDFKSLAKAFNFPTYSLVKSKKDLLKIIKIAYKSKNSSFIHIKIRNDEGKESKRVSDVYKMPQVTKRFMKSV